MNSIFIGWRDCLHGLKAWIRRPALVFIFIFSTLILCFWLNVVDRATTEQKTTGNRIQNLTSRLSCSLPGKLMINGVHPTFSKSLMVSVAVSKLGCSGLVFVDPGKKINSSYYWRRYRYMSTTWWQQWYTWYGCHQYGWKYHHDQVK